MDSVQEAEDYDAMDHGDVNRRFVDDLLMAMPSWPEGDSLPNIVDLGTGTALIPLELLSRSVDIASILACDLAAEMLKLAKSNLLRHPQGNKAVPVYCDAKQLPIEDRSCDVLMSNSIVHHIPDPIRVFREMKRVLRPGGLLFVRDLMRPGSADEVERIVETYAGNENEFQQQMFRQSLHAALTVEEVRQLLLNSGFDADTVTATSDRHWTICGHGPDR